jgi:hypothetical protein
VIIHTVGDTAPVWTFRLRSRGGAFDLSAPGAAVAAKVKLSDASTVSKPGEITDPEGGEFTVTWATADLDIPGLAKLDLLYTATGGVIQHARKPIDVWIRPEYVDPETP